MIYCAKTFPFTIRQLCWGSTNLTTVTSKRSSFGDLGPTRIHLIRQEIILFAGEAGSPLGARSIAAAVDRNSRVANSCYFSSALPSCSPRLVSYPGTFPSPLLSERPTAQTKQPVFGTIDSDSQECMGCGRFLPVIADAVLLFGIGCRRAPWRLYL